MQILLIMLIVVLLAFSVLLLALANKVPGKSRQKTKSRKNTSGIMQKQ